MTYKGKGNPMKLKRVCGVVVVGQLLVLMLLFANAIGASAALPTPIPCSCPTSSVVVVTEYAPGPEVVYVPVDPDDTNLIPPSWGFTVLANIATVLAVVLIVGVPRYRDRKQT